jgi:hypothetical protein
MIQQTDAGLWTSLRGNPDFLGRGPLFLGLSFIAMVICAGASS